MIKSRIDPRANEWTDARTRRTVLNLMAGAAGGGLAGLLGVVQAEPGERKRKRQRRRKRRQRNAGGPALYPDLRTLVPEGLRFAQLSDGAHVLRFTNTVWNAGEGRLELAAPTSPEKQQAGALYQNLYDAPVAGQRVSRRRVRGTILYHDTHEHYHFADFASYTLLERDDAGVYQPIGEGTKTSFCIIDSSLVQGSHDRNYIVCERKRQGLTPGWGDTYASNLPEQWVVLENGPLADGEYALQSIADPRGLLAEDGGIREQNNAATAYFTVASGALGNVRNSPTDT